MTTETISAAELKEIRKRISELEKTTRVMVASDSGTHGQPAVHHIYEEITGERYAVRQFANANGYRMPEQDARDCTDGYFREFPKSQHEIRELRSELKRLRERLRKAGG